jgi:hypothetical protein
VRDVIRDLAATGRAEGVLVCPQGFVSDHLEVLYDLDIDARRVAADSGLAFGRTASINDDPVVMAALAERVRRTEASPPGVSPSGRGNGERWGEADAMANGERSSSPRAARTVRHRLGSPDP